MSAFPDFKFAAHDGRALKFLLFDQCLQPDDDNVRNLAISGDSDLHSNAGSDLSCLSKNIASSQVIASTQAPCVVRTYRSSGSGSRKTLTLLKSHGIPLQYCRSSAIPTWILAWISGQGWASASGGLSQQSQVLCAAR